MRKFTNWEDPKVLSIVSKEISAHPENLTQAFKNISEKIGCTPGAVSFSWYSGRLKKLVGVQFATATKNVLMTNRKNKPAPNPTVGTLVHQKVLDSKVVDGLRVTTIRQYYAV